MRLRHLLLYAVSCIYVGLAFAQNPTASPGATLGSGIDASHIDSAVRPQDNLFQYANGAWLKRTPIPPDRSSYGEMAEMTEDSVKQQHQLLEIAKNATEVKERKAGDFYQSFMDQDTIEHKGLAPLQQLLDQVNAVQRPGDLGGLMGALYRLGVPAPVMPEIDADAKDSAHYAFYLNQGGIGLPDRDYFLSDDKKMIGFRTAYLAHLEATFQLMGDANAHAEALDVFALETKMAKIEWTEVQNRDPIKTYNAKTLPQLAQLAPEIDWVSFFREAGISKAPTIVVAQPSYFSGLSKLMHATPLAIWQEYFRLRIVSARSPYLPERFVDEDFSFNHKVLSGTPVQSERWKRGAGLVDQMMGEELGQLYVAAYFPASTKTQVEGLVRNLIKAYGDSIDHLDWMSPPTRQQAHFKLSKIKVKIGYPDQWRDYSALQISATDLMGNVDRAQRFEQDRKAAQLPGPVDRNEWGMTPQTVNDYYSSGLNEVVFPAASLQPPAYDPHADDAYNYGSTGATIGHELSHAFDDQGSQYDASGNLRDWWTKQDHAKFRAKTAVLIRQYSGFEPVPGFHINGALTLGENIADLAGLEIAYKAYHDSLEGQNAASIDGLSGDQRFFLGFAQSWLGEEREAAEISQLKSDPHSPDMYRTNAVVVHLPSFYEAFSVKPADKMYLSPKDRVELW